MNSHVLCHPQLAPRPDNIFIESESMTQPQPLSPLSEAARIDASTRSGRRKMLLLLLICAAPVAASYFTFYVIKPTGVTNFGTLIQPVRQIPTELMVSESNSSRSAAPQALRTMFPNQWLMVSVDGAGQCAESCLNKLFMMRQIRVAQNNERNRVVPVWLVTDDAPIDARIQEAYGEATAAGRFLRVKREALTAWLPAEDQHSIENTVYLVDAQGNLMMRFPSQPEPKKIIAGLAKLLKWNPIGKLD